MRTRRTFLAASALLAAASSPAWAGGGRIVVMPEDGPQELADDSRKRDLPGSCIKAFERVCGNTAVSQWLAMQAQLTVSEEAIADKQAARAAA